MSDGGNNDAQAVIDVVERLVEPTTIDLVRGTPETARAIALAKGLTLHSMKPLLDVYLKRPERKEGTTTLTTLDAFCDYTKRHAEPESVVFVDDTTPASPRLLTVFNAHGQSDKGHPDWQDHRAVYRFPLSEEWAAWMKLPAAFAQADFAAFLEERITDVLDPAGAGERAAKFAAELGVQLAGPTRLLELSRGLSVAVDQKVQSHVNLSSGEAQFVFAEEHKDGAGQPLKVPGAFAIGIPVFRGGVGYRIPVRLRYRVSGGKVSWQLSPQRTDRVLEDAISEAAGAVAKATGLAVFRGSPDVR